MKRNEPYRAYQKKGIKVMPRRTHKTPYVLRFKPTRKDKYYFAGFGRMFMSDELYPLWVDLGHEDMWQMSKEDAKKTLHRLVDRYHGNPVHCNPQGHYKIVKYKEAKR